MSKEEDNKAIVGRWFTDFWGKTCNLDIVDELAAPDMLLQYSLHDPRRGRDDIKAFMTDFRKAFPDLNFWGAADLIAEGDHVVGRWEGGGTHTGPAFSDFLAGYLPAATGRRAPGPREPRLFRSRCRGGHFFAPLLGTRGNESHYGSRKAELDGRNPMSKSAQEFEEFARDCVRLAEQADTPALREKLLGLAREWMQAVMDVEDAEARTGK
jgi:hypothetical protein